MEDRVSVGEFSVGKALLHLAAAAQEHQDTNDLSGRDADDLRLFFREAVTKAEQALIHPRMDPNEVRSWLAKAFAIAAAVAEKKGALDKAFPISGAEIKEAVQDLAAIPGQVLGEAIDSVKDKVGDIVADLLDGVDEDETPVIAPLAALDVTADEPVVTEPSTGAIARPSKRK